MIRVKWDGGVDGELRKRLLMCNHIPAVLLDKYRAIDV